ncbi:MAG: hypothetical protein CMH57_05105 [Myxococcales bacterium]|nr:hypothetical protein [Myxococcales bacterium]
MNHPRPPRDTWSWLILGLGGGCLTLFTLLGVVLLYGSLEAGQLCADRVDDARKEAARPAQDLLDATGRGDYEAALAMMDEAYREQHDLASFKGFVGSFDDLLVGGRAEVVDMGARGDVSWLTVRIKEPRTGTVKGVATLELVWPRPRTPKSRKKIQNVYRGAARDHKAEERVAAFLQTHAGYLDRGDVGRAHGQVDPGFTDRDTFRAFIGSQGELFAAGMTLEVIDVRIKDPRQAEVLTRILDRASGAVRGQVVYSVVIGPKRRLMITGIQTQQEAPDDRGDDAGERDANEP